MNRAATAFLRLALFAAFVSLPALTFAQSITTYAGGGNEDGQLATDIAAYGPRGVALDRAGNVYFAERFAGRVRRVDIATGHIITIAGTGASGFSGDGGAATNGTLRGPADSSLTAMETCSLPITTTIAFAGSTRPAA